VTVAVLVVNSGSSSVKYQVVDPTTQTRLAGGLVERIGEAGSSVRDHEAAVEQMINDLRTEGIDLQDPDRLAAVGHRVVHGASRFVEPTLVTDEVVAAITELVPLAPLHNPGNLAGITALRRLCPEVPHVAVFDTAFHRDLPAYASMYAIPLGLASEHGVRRYGFHGTSYAWVTRGAAELLGHPIESLAIVALHLGNGCSAAAVLGGRSVDTSMGLSPLEGLVMGTRSGDLDPAVVFHLHRTAGLALDDIELVLTKQSGLMGLAGDNDLRAIEARAADGDVEASLALDVTCYRIRKYVGAYAAAMGRLDAVVLTGGIGENSPYVRAHALAGLDLLGVAVDPARNDAPGRHARRISPDDAPVQVLVVPTNEEMEIGLQTLALVQPDQTVG
jgi:acetate kinase